MSGKMMVVAALGLVAVALVVIGLVTDSGALVVGAIVGLLVLLGVGSVLVWRSAPPGSLTEGDVATDDAVAGSRVTGGGTDIRTGDNSSTTGAGPSDSYVGRIAGDPDSAAGQSGAEARAQASRRDSRGPHTDRR